MRDARRAALASAFTFGGAWPSSNSVPSGSSAAGSWALFAYSTRNGGSRYWLICEYFDIIWRNSGLDAMIQSMQRDAPCESVKHNDQVWCSSSSTGLFTLMLNSSAKSV